MVPMPQMTWGQWRAAHPSTLVLDPDTPFRSHYESPVRIGMAGRSESMYGDGRLPSNARVVGVEAMGQFTGFPIEVVDSEAGVVNALVGGVPVVVVYDAQSQTGIAYSRTLDQAILAFDAGRSRAGVLRLVDRESGTTWDVEGNALSGPLTGNSLTFVPSLISEWYGWSGYHPETTLYQGAPDGSGS